MVSAGDACFSQPLSPFRIEPDACASWLHSLLFRHKQRIIFIIHVCFIHCQIPAFSEGPFSNKGWSIHGGHDPVESWNRNSHFGIESTVRRRHRQDLPHPLTNPRSACLMRRNRNARKERGGVTPLPAPGGRTDVRPRMYVSPASVQAAGGSAF